MYQHPASRLAILCALVAGLAHSADITAAPRWRQVGGTGVSAGYAGPVGTPVQGAWFSADGARLQVILRGGARWVSRDEGLTWKPDTATEAPPLEGITSSEDSPRGVVRNPYRAGVLYALGEHLYRSDDGGGEWTNLTAIGPASVIGRWQSTLTVSPVDSDLIVVGNSLGLWKSHDAGVTWSGLNSTLPNFPEARFANPDPSSALTLWVPGLGSVELVRGGGGQFWRTAPEPSLALNLMPPDERLRAGLIPNLLPPGFAVSHRVWRDGRPVSGDLTGCGSGPRCASLGITALAVGGRIWAGTSNGRIWVSENGGEEWRLSWEDPSGSPVESLWTDPHLPETALAVAGDQVLRSTNGGVSWFAIGSDLPVSHWRAVKGHPASSTVYVAGPLGVYFAAADLEVPGPVGQWTELRGDLPEGGVHDLALDPSRGRIYALVPAFGVYWARTPQADLALRALSSADLSERPAAPGSLLTVVGTAAASARANGQPAPILNSEPGRTQLQIPFGLRGRSVRLRLAEPSAVHTLDVELAAVSPAIFVVGGEPLVLDAGTGALVGWQRPATAGSTVLVMVTGLGKVIPPWPAGVPSPDDSPPRTVATVQATVNGSSAAVLAAHLAPGFTGIYLVEVALPPDTPAGAAQLAISADGQTSNAVGVVVRR